MPTSQDRKIQNIAINTVNTMFDLLQDPKNKGPNFSWDNFPLMMKNLTQAYAGTAFYHISGQKLQLIEEKIGKLAFELAQEKVDSMKKTSLNF